MKSDETLRALPSVDRVLRSLPPELSFRPSVLTYLVREAVDRARQVVTEGGEAPALATIVASVVAAAEDLRHAGPERVINATGIVLHTNLGRAPLGASVFRAMERELSGYCALEFDVEEGRRGKRTASLERACRVLWDAPAALVVNNAAGAVLLCLHALARDRAVVLSRGELVQIGGGFRVPEILEASGARLVEVGTTNITTVGDYAAALTRHQDVGALLRVHRSNFRLEGHVETPSLRALGRLATERGIPLIVDLGSAGPEGAVGYGEETVAACLRAGVSAVCFSGDKALGGPQAGLVLGEKVVVERLRASPLYRALRLGKLDLFALGFTVQQWLAAEERPLAETRLQRSAEVLRADADALHAALASQSVYGAVVELSVPLGGGTEPGRELPSWGVAIETRDAERLARSLLRATPPIVVRRAEGAVVIDPRTLLPDDHAAVVRALAIAER